MVMIDPRKETISMVLLSVIIASVIVIFIGYLDTLHKKNVKKLSEPPLIVCSFCKGTGERLTDINKLMMDAKFQLFLNKHLSLDRCKNCIELSNGFDYCNIVTNYYDTLYKEYLSEGPKIDMATCEKCMGMGTFNSKDLNTDEWNTQEDWEKKINEID